MTVLPKEELEDLEKVECPLTDVGFDPETIDGRGNIEKEKPEE